MATFRQCGRYALNTHYNIIRARTHIRSSSAFCPLCHWWRRLNDIGAAYGCHLVYNTIMTESNLLFELLKFYCLPFGDVPSLCQFNGPLAGLISNLNLKYKIIRPIYANEKSKHSNTCTESEKKKQTKTKTDILKLSRCITIHLVLEIANNKSYVGIIF